MTAVLALWQSGLKCPKISVPKSIYLSDISCFISVFFFTSLPSSHILHSPQSTIPCFVTGTLPPPPRNCFNCAACLAFLTSLLHFRHRTSPFFSPRILKSFTCASSQSVWPMLICSALPGNEGNSEWNTEVVNFFDHTTLPRCSYSKIENLHCYGATQLSPHFK